jgi:DNA ligase D-like protein (predicted 3'-phosphoesterase)
MHIKKGIIKIVLPILLIGSTTMATNKLKTYRKRRALKKTSKVEPYGKVKKTESKKPLFVVQKHDASHLHYDFRLEMSGVLASWAVPKGPPTTLGVRRLAIPTDDHPMEYSHFEGIIPEGDYGGGTVMVWDIGTFDNIKYENGSLVPMEECYRRGTIEIFLEGKKLFGPYALVKTKGLTSKESWILLKMNSKNLSAQQKPKGAKKSTAKIGKEVSVLTKRTMKQIADDKDDVWE